jgi:predicted PurR-regulated permease PerM
MTDTNEQSFLRGAGFLAGVIVALAALYFGREVLIPLALAALLCFLLTPAVQTLERLRLGRVLSVLAVVGGSVGVVGVFGWLVATQVSQVADDFQTYRHNILARVQVLDESIRGATGRISQTIETLSPPHGANATQPAPDLAADVAESAVSDATTGHAQSQPEPVQVEVVSPRDSAFATVGRVLGIVVHPAATAGVTVLFVIFFLIYREDLRDRVIRVCGRARIHVTTAALADSANRVTRYVVAQVLANGMIGLAIGLGLFALGIPSAALWGFMAGVFRFVPYVGAFVAAFFPVAQAVAISDGWMTPMLVLGWIVLVDSISANLVEPWLFGSRTGASPTAIVVAFVLWGWLWGGIGLILATPITVCLVVLGKHIPAFEVFHVLLGDEPVLEPKARFYQRLLATNAKEATAIAKEFASEHSALAACEQVIVPALVQLEYDRRSGVLDDTRVEFARETVREFLTEQPALLAADADPAEPIAGDPPPIDDERSPLLLFVLDRGPFDDLVPLMLSFIAATENWRTHVLSKDSLSTDVVEQFRSLHPAAVVITAIEPRDSSRIRHICARLNTEDRTIPLHIAVFGSRQREQGFRTRVGRDATEFHSTLGSLADALRGIAARTVATQPMMDSRQTSAEPELLPAS